MSDFETGVPVYDGDIAPGDERADGREIAEGILGYLIGLGLSILFTAVAFYVSRTSLVWQPSIPAALIVLAIAQMGVHIVFFLHITTRPDSVNNLMALMYGVFIVFVLIVGSVWIMTHLNYNMMPMERIMLMQR
ncbi:MAG TPA: cytochrome o ubiquinol oxidase subunit IV [Terracidiphilus sp.]|jgi:cytochrome o ubiquinol oxidase subunit IV